MRQKQKFSGKMTPILLTEGDILDRLSILEVKKIHGLSVDFLPFDRYIADNSNYRDKPEYKELLKVNSLLWDIEDNIRKAHSDLKQFKEDSQMYDQAAAKSISWKQKRIVGLSDQVITENKRRSDIKKKIDGQLAEPKKYATQE